MKGRLSVDHKTMINQMMSSVWDFKFGRCDFMARWPRGSGQPGFESLLGELFTNNKDFSPKLNPLQLTCG